MFTRKETNKLISYVDRYFTWDDRKMKRENTSICFDFRAVREAELYHPSITVIVDKLSNGIYVAIKQDAEYIHSQIITTNKELTAFKKMVRCLG